MFILKDYQQWALDALRDYFQECSRTDDANISFYSSTEKTIGINISYNKVEALPGLPYVCLRIPTGGGKTVVACHSIGIASRELAHAESPVVLWLVPSNAILDQTMDALQNREHPYRQAIESTVGLVEVLDIKSALRVKRAQLDNQVTIILTTMQSFRVDKDVGRKVYEDSGELMDHFSGLPTHVEDVLEKGPQGNIIHSLTNVLRLRMPIVIVDEAHNARTPLSFTTLARFRPSCIIEFTATPARENNASNILYSVSAADLKSAQMIKMPIQLSTRSDWKELLSDAIHCRHGLEKISSMERQETGEYIRPIMLLQAQPRRQGQETLTVDVVKQALISDHNVPEEQIVIATGSIKGLDDINDISSPDEPTRYVITVQALKEGWDCPFAYVLCSVAESRSVTAIEQLLGRVMRLPSASWKNHDELNMAYAFATSESFSEIAKTLTDALVKSGFDKQEAKDLIIPMRGTQKELPYTGNSFMNLVQVTMKEQPALEHLPEIIRKKYRYDGTKKELIFAGPMTESERDQIKSVCKTKEAKKGIEQAYIVSTAQNAILKREPTPSERGLPFDVPLLALKQGELFDFFEDSHFLDYAWKLSECEALLVEKEYSSERPESQTGEIDITEKGKVAAKFVSRLQTQMGLFASDKGWTVARLTHWFDNNIPHDDIDSEETGLFLTRLVQALIDQRNIPLERLVIDKFRLKKVAADKIDLHRKSAKKNAYQTLLFGKDAQVSVSPDICFSFPIDRRKYCYSKTFKGHYEFNKHYYPEIGDLEDSGEEFECAQYIDQLNEVDYWVRNPVRRPEQSFWLQTSTDKFYPDFVCKLKDGRILVVEYKGAHLWNDDSKEKLNIGELWAQRSHGKCLFVMPIDRNYDKISSVINSG